MNYKEMEEIIQQANIDDLRSKLDILRDDSDEAITSSSRCGLLRDWMGRNKGAFSANDFATKIIPAIGDVGIPDTSFKKSLEVSLAERFIENNPSTSFIDLKDVILPLFQKSYEKRNALSGWMRSPSNAPDIDIFINQFIPVIDGTVALPLIKDWMGCAAISTHDLKERIFAIPYSEERSLNNSEKLELAKIFMDRPENKNSSPEEKLATATILFPESNFVSNLKRNWLAKEGRLSFAEWTSRNLNEYGVTLNDLASILDSTDQYDQGRKSLTTSCVKLEIKSANLDAKRLVAEIFPLDDSVYSKRDWASEWMKSRSSNASLRISDLQNILPSFKGDSSNQDYLIKSYWNCTMKRFEDLKEVLPELVKNNYSYGFRIDDLIRDYETRNDTTLGLEQLKEIVPLVDDKQKLSLVQNWIRDSRNASELNNLCVSTSSLKEYLTYKNEVGSPISGKEMTAAQIIASPNEDHKCLLVLAATDQNYLTNQRDARNISGNGSGWSSFSSGIILSIKNKIADQGQYPVAHLNEDNSVSFFLSKENQDRANKSLDDGFQKEFITKQLRHQSAEKGFQTISGRDIVERTEHLDSIEYRVNLSPENLDSILKLNSKYVGYRDEGSILKLTRDFTLEDGVINLFPVFRVNETEFAVQASGCQLYEMPALQLMRLLPSYESTILPQHQRDGFNFHWDIKEVKQDLGLSRYPIANILNTILTDNQASEIYTTDQGEDSLTILNNGKISPIKVAPITENTKEFYAMYGNCSREELDHCLSVQIDLVTFLQETKKYLDENKSETSADHLEAQKNNIAQMIKNEQVRQQEATQRLTASGQLTEIPPAPPQNSETNIENTRASYLTGNEARKPAPVVELTSCSNLKFPNTITNFIERIMGGSGGSGR